MVLLGDRVASSPLTCASYQQCSRTLRRGQVKRVSQRGPLVGYFLACPACGFSAAYLDDACGFREVPREEGARPARALVGVAHPPTCFSCHALLSVEPSAGGHDLVARRPGVAA